MFRVCTDLCRGLSVICGLSRGSVLMNTVNSKKITIGGFCCHQMAFCVLSCAVTFTYLLAELHVDIYAQGWQRNSIL